jgi:hypothetical protein
MFERRDYGHTAQSLNAKKGVIAEAITPDNLNSL